MTDVRRRLDELLCCALLPATDTMTRAHRPFVREPGPAPAALAAPCGGLHDLVDDLRPAVVAPMEGHAS